MALINIVIFCETMGISIIIGQKSIPASVLKNGQNSVLKSGQKSV